MPDKFVLQHNVSGTIHQLKPGGKATYCGKGVNSGPYTRRRWSKAMERKGATHCQAECIHHQN